MEPIQLLTALNIIRPEAIRTYFPRVRDDESTVVKICDFSKVIFLEKNPHTDGYYENKSDLSYWVTDEERATALQKTYPDDKRRFDAYNNVAAGKRYLDVGTGLGGMLDLMKEVASEVVAIEPQKGAREVLQNLGYTVYSSIEDVASEVFDVITLFHVFEHMSRPLEELYSLYKLLSPGGVIIIEVPHAKDSLIQFYESDAFKKFTFWSEHLILHTRASLEKILQQAGFKHIKIEGYQRYSFANHLYWLSKGKPGGHEIWKHLDDLPLNERYIHMLNENDMTDTLIALAYKI